MLEQESRDDLGQALSPELFQRIKALQIRTQRLVTEVMAGEYESAFRGRGMEFEEVREYQPGDDIRHIDWNVTARSGVPHVKQFREERELTVMLMVDVSSSGAFGSSSQLKSEVTAEIAAVLAYTAIHSNDRVGLIVFSDTVERYIPPKKGRAHVWRVIREILGFRPSRQGTDLEAALDFLNRVSRRAAVAFVLSDFYDSGYEDRLRVAARRHDVTAITICDRREAELPPIGILELEDAESGEVVVVDTRDPDTIAGFEERARRHREELDELFRSAGVGEVRVRTDRPYIDDLVRYFHARERRR
jgi:uncharacterized protein (DUF58 family)